MSFSSIGWTIVDCTSSDLYLVYTMQGKVNRKWPAYEEANITRELRSEWALFISCKQWRNKESFRQKTHPGHRKYWGTTRGAYYCRTPVTGRPCQGGRDREPFVLFSCVLIGCFCKCINYGTKFSNIIIYLFIIWNKSISIDFDQHFLISYYLDLLLFFAWTFQDMDNFALSNFRRAYKLSRKRTKTCLLRYRQTFSTTSQQVVRPYINILSNSTLCMLHNNITCSSKLNAWA